MSLKDKRVGYFYDEELTNHNYGGGNPMRPHRVRLTHSLVENYNLNQRMLVHRPEARSKEQIENFHCDEYVDFLNSVTPDNQDEYLLQMRRFNLGPVGEADCPVFDGMFEYCAIYSGGSVSGAALMNEEKTDICINWAGGMHHAKKAEASGFCYINDIVLAILELLKKHQRVLYVDIDIHHGDGVEEAFYLTDRVMTVSFHKYGDFFPGTGALGDTGHQGGKHYSVNVPLQEGMDDESYKFVFEPIMQKVMEVYQPGAIVVCGGADSLSGDRLGCFNLSLQGHAHCMDFLAKFNVPMLVLGGGGYTMRNVARCWCYETGRMLAEELPDDLPTKALSNYDYYMDTHRLRISVSNMKNANTREELELIKATVLKNLSDLDAAPSAQLAPRPPAFVKAEPPEEDMDVRGGGAAADDARIVKPGYESDDEADEKRWPGHHTSAAPMHLDNSYPQDRRTSPLPDMAKAEAKLAEMVKHESKPAAEENGSGAPIKPEQGTEPGAQHAQQARGQDESYLASLAKPHGPSTHSNIAPPPAVQGPAAGISAQPTHPSGTHPAFASGRPQWGRPSSADGSGSAGSGGQQQRSQTPPAGATETTREPVHPPPEGPPYEGETKPADAEAAEARNPYS
ncbi:g4307 [Coccomyxa viridis]|uniref:histone deacetylase n=1 Tax=Coccomyxa viridis TaxID=1274662 RepID=A0ABP1FWW5_9CHLO